MTERKLKSEENTAPPAVAEDTGIALVGKYPLNHRLRAEALHKAGVKSDPDNIIDAEAIAAAGPRIAAAEKAEKAEQREAKADGDTASANDGKGA